MTLGIPPSAVSLSWVVHEMQGFQSPHVTDNPALAHSPQQDVRTPQSLPGYVNSRACRPRPRRGSVLGSDTSGIPCMRR